MTLKKDREARTGDGQCDQDRHESHPRRAGAEASSNSCRRLLYDVAETSTRFDRLGTKLLRTRPIRTSSAFES